MPMTSAPPLLLAASAASESWYRLVSCRLLQPRSSHLLRVHIDALGDRDIDLSQVYILPVTSVKNWQGVMEHRAKKKVALTEASRRPVCRQQSLNNGRTDWPHCVLCLSFVQGLLFLLSPRLPEIYA